MSIEDFKKTHRKWNLFQDIDTLGSYDFFTSVVDLTSLSPRHILNMKSALEQLNHKKPKGEKLSHEQYSSLAKVLPLASHEYTHFIDATSTLWGLRHLALLNNAYLADDKMGGTEEDFKSAKKFYDHTRSIHLPKYYTTIELELPETRPWQSVITMGKVFTSDGTTAGKPVLFSRFFNANGDCITRSPVSTISILEASAMAQEIFAQASLLDVAEDNFKTIENNLHSKKVLSELYNKRLTEYSVCVHIVSNHLKCKEALTSFGICAVLTRLVLNMPKSCLEIIYRNCNIAKILNIPARHEFETRMSDGIKNGDLGIIFYLLCKALPQRPYNNHTTVMLGAVAALDKLGLNMDLIAEEGQIEAKSLFESLERSKIASIRLLANAGIDNFKKQEYKESRLDFQKLSIPNALLDDLSFGEIFSSENNILADLNMEDCYQELFSGQRWVERFAEACL
ncbi:hypothetical protein [Pseudomonas mosselii]|uniref:Uncharacterized protein n=1 Tax=Pseudomonas mosselii TaxID=78327 RepID=A0AA42RU13_9PSED|nr:hypothetical protein [Pseudomonas mosselii]MDH1629857.1 hypothetical protein [Pseudomonas mosselii]